MSRGRIEKALSGFYYVNTGAEVLQCRARGKFRKEGMSPLVGDWVEVQELGGGEGLVQRIEPRRSQFQRPAAANVDQLVVNLSGGNQQKVVIAKWLVRNCDILIFDEPTRGIDVGAKSEIYHLMNELVAAGKSIIMISSEMTEILRMSDRIIVMCEGRVTGEIGIEEATQERIMHAATLRK